VAWSSTSGWNSKGWSRPPGSSGSTWNPSDKNANVTLSGANLTATGNNATYGSVRGTLSHSTGKWAFPFNNISGGAWEMGLALGSASLGGDLGAQSGATVWYAGDGGVYSGGTIQGGVGAPGSTGNILAVDLTAHLLWFFSTSTGQWNNSGTADPASGVGGITIASGTYFPGFSGHLGGSADSVTADFANNGAVTLPSGFTAWG
jgi:hypothetical protein